MRFDGLLDQVVKGGFKVLCLLQIIGVLPQRFGHRGVQHDIAASNGVGGTQHPKLELIAGESKG